MKRGSRMLDIFGGLVHAVAVNATLESVLACGRLSIAR